MHHITVCHTLDAVCHYIARRQIIRFGSDKQLSTQSVSSPGAVSVIGVGNQDHPFHT